MIPVALLAFLAGLSFGIMVWQFLAARRFPLHRRDAVAGFAPAVTLLKPLKGRDEHTRACLESWLVQDYAGPVQILFAVQDPADPVCEVVRELLAAHPGRDARLCAFPDRIGANAKVSQLAQAEPLAIHGLVLVSDADVRVPRDFLANVVVPMRDPAVGLVNCFYRLANPVTTAMRWEATAANADFWSQVLQARTLAPMDFALGAAMLVRREALAGIGGFRALVDHLADDFQLGHRIARNGHRVELSPVVVECLDAPADWAAVWAHQLRWNRTIRVCRPAPYAASVLSNGTLWPVLATAAVWLSPAVSAVSAGRLTGLFLLLVFLRSLMAQVLARRFAAIPGRRSDGDPYVFGMVPWKDLLGFVVWAAAFFGDTVVWRGLAYRVGRDGRLTPA